MTQKTSSKDCKMRSKGENKTVLSWKIRSPIMLELKDKSRGVGLFKKRMEMVEESEGNFSIISHLFFCMLSKVSIEL